MPVESTSFYPNPGCVCGCGWVGAWAGGWMCKCASCMWVSEWVSVCVCCTHLFSFFTLAFVLVNDLFSGFVVVFVLEMRTILFLLFLFASFCCMHLYSVFTAVSYQMFFHWCSFMYPHWGFWNKPLDLCVCGGLLRTRAPCLWMSTV